MGASDDRVIWDYALQTNATIITKDEDFVSLLSLATEAPSIVWIRVGNVSKQALLSWITPMIPTIIAEIESGEKLIEIA